MKNRFIKVRQLRPLHILSGKRQLLLNIASEKEVFELIGDELVENLTATTQEKIQTPR